MSVRSARWLATGLSLVAGALIAGPGGPPTIAAQATPAATPSPACVADAEPNDTPTPTAVFTAPGCIQGTLADGDAQDLLLWDIPEDDSRHAWSFTIDGPAGTLTGAQLLPVTSEPGAMPITAGGAILEVAHGPDDQGPVTEDGILLPAGRYLLGIARSARPDGGPVADPSYRLEVDAGSPLPPAVEREPNDDPSTATAVRDLFSLSGDLQGSSDYYRWTVTDAIAGSPIEVDATGPVGGGLTLALQRPDGSTMKYLGTFETDGLGVIRFRDVVLPAGDYLLVLAPYADHPFPYRLDVLRSSSSGVDPEPNDDPTVAAPLDPGRLAVRGRLTLGDPRDRYLLTVDDGLAGRLLDIRLIWRDGPQRQLCLEATDARPIQCRNGDRGVSLTGLSLAPGPYVVEVQGDPAPDTTYLLRIDATSAVAPDFETEPNDTPDSATPMSVRGAMSGLFDGDDPDLFRVTVTGDVPQLWQLDVRGTGLDDVRWLAADGDPLARARSNDDHTAASLTDLYLIPGDHWFRVDGVAGGEYKLGFTALGPPDPDAELEPNDASLDAQAIAVGGSRTGRLPGWDDVDVFRFTLDSPEHVRLSVTPPTDGAIRLMVTGGSIRFADFGASEPDVPLVWDGMLEPGDYEAWLMPNTPSSGRYRFSIEREDPFARSDDQEPNDAPWAAGPVPASLHVDGRGRPGGDVDWYSLAALPNGGDLLVRASSSVDRVDVAQAMDGNVTYPGQRTEDGSGFLLAGLPAGTPLWVRVAVLSDVAYTLDLDPGTTGLPAPVAPPAPLAATLAVTTSRDVVAAFRDVGQEVRGSIAIANAGTTDLDVSLDAATSDHHWSATPDSDHVRVPAAGSVDVPLAIRVLPDAGSDQPVRITVRARAASGAQVTGWTELRTDRDLEAVAPYRAWSVPTAVLGGLDVAAAAIGGSPVSPADPEAEAQLYDGLTPSGRGYQGTFDGTPVTFTVDLAGDAPVPIAGMALNPLAARDSMAPVPRRFTLLLSDDGAAWAEALQGELRPLDEDQWFVLPAPRPARFARLRVDGTWGGPGSRLAIGEWKVVATPGAVPDAMPSNIAEPVRGGHVVWLAPQLSSQDEADSMLTDDPAEYRTLLYATAGTRPVWVVGFQDDREARIDRLEWQDPPGSDSVVRMRRVSVAVSDVSPIGPWTPVGTWTLRRAKDGAVEPYALADGTWARFIRFTGSPVPKGQYVMELPGAVRVMEHPTDAGYRTILGEWGYTSPQGPWELAMPPDLTPVVDSAGDDDTADHARPLVAGTIARDRVHRGQDVDWYSVAIPEGQNSVTLTVGGTPSVGVALTMVDASGHAVPMTFGPGDRPGTVRYDANVTGGATYDVRVEQPPFSAVFTFDTSGSMGAYLSFVEQALAAYTGGVVPGEEQVLVIPFEEPPLLKEWSDDRYRLQDAVNRYTLATGGSSGAEAALTDAADALAGREGARAVLLVTDAETSSYGQNQDLWARLDAVRPIVFAAHVGADSYPRQDRHFMQDWAMAGGGSYQYAVSHGDMDRAFDRMATWLRRPVGYTLGYETSQVAVPPPPPGTLAVMAPVEADGTTSAVVGKDVAIELVLDTSGSMLERFGGRRRIDVARTVLARLVRNDIPAGVHVALRTFVRKANSCDTMLAVPLGPLDPEAMASRIEGIGILRSVNTPLAKAIRAVADDLAGVTGPRIVIVVSDGEENCKGDPAREVRRLVSQGFDVTLNVVGLSLDDKRVRRSIQRLARLGHGTYFDARRPDQVAKAIRTAVSAPFRVYDEDGGLVARGTVGGAPVRLPPGTYRVVVLTDPQMTYAGVVVETGGSVVVTLPSAGDRPVEPEPPATSPAPGASATPAP